MRQTRYVFARLIQNKNIVDLINGNDKVIIYTRTKNGNDR